LVNYKDKYTEMHGQQNIKKQYLCNYTCKVIYIFYRGTGAINPLPISM